MRLFPHVLPLALSLLLATPAAPAQSSPDKPDRYAAESFVLNSTLWLYSENADGTGYREHTVAVEVRSEAAVRLFGVVGVPFASASEHVEFHYARVRHKDGTLTETPITDVIEQPEEVTREAPFYSDLKQAQLPIKNLQVGDTLEWQARIIKTRAEAANQFWGQESFFAPTDGVALKESVELHVPTASAANVWTNPELNVKPVQTTDGTTTIYRWDTSQLKPTAGDEADAAKKAGQGKPQTPTEQLDAKEGKLPSLMWTTFQSWPAVGAWYRGLEGSRATPDDEIKAKVATLIAGKTTEEEKVRAVYAYVSTQIHYIGVAFGIGRFQPHEAADVLHNQYGDCKDKATLLASMLAVLGLHADSVLIGSEIRINEAVPSPQSFNHLITRVKVGDKEVWLDPTTEVGPYQVLLYPLRDKLALVIPDQGAAELLRTPKDLPFPSFVTWKAVGSLDKNGISDSHITMTLRGDYEVLYRAAIHQVSPGQYEQAAEKVVPSMGYSGKVSHGTFTRPEDTAEPFIFSFDYHREKAGDWDNLKTIPQVMPAPFPLLDDKDPPSAPILLGIPHTETSDAEMKLPANWTAELPEAIHEKSPWATYDVTYRFDKGTVYTVRKAVILIDRVPVADWKAWKKFTDACGAGNEPYIQLRRGSAATTLPSPVITSPQITNLRTTAPVRISPVPASSLPPSQVITSTALSSDTPTTTIPEPDDTSVTSDTLIDNAYQAIQKLDPEKAKSLLKRVETRNPKTPRLWAAKADLAMALGVMSEAEDDAKKEVALHPDEYAGYEVLYRVKVMRRENEGIGDTLTKMVALQPDNEPVTLALAYAMMYEKKYPEAVAAADKAATLLGPEDALKNEPLQLLLGRAQLKSGRKPEGDATLTALLKTTDNPGTMNDAAYELADANLELPLDEQKVREALDRFTAETSAWTGDENQQTLRQKSSLLVATWDTMGWILFREGRLTEAASYILPAVLTRPDGDVVEHAAALKKATDPHARPKPPVKGDVTVTATAGNGRQVPTIPLGSANGHKGFARYRILLEKSGVDRVQAVDQPTMEGMDDTLKHLNVAKYFPPNSTAKLEWRATVNCAMGNTCFLMIDP